MNGIDQEKMRVSRDQDAAISPTSDRDTQPGRTQSRAIHNRAALFFPSVLAACILYFAAPAFAQSSAHELPSTAQTVTEDPAQGDGRVSAFYSVQGSLPAAPGQLIRAEPLPPTLGLSEAAYQFRILYTSTDGVTGQGTVPVSGALFIPKGQPPQGGWPVIAWAHGTEGVADICAPSWAGRSYRDARYLNTWLDQGFVIVATDYQGLGTPGPHPYQNTRPEAYSVLDSVRSVLDTPLNVANRIVANKVVIIGQSQGGGAAFSATGYAPTYAPDLNVLGTVATGMPNLTLSGLTAPPTTDPNIVDPPLAYNFYLVLMGQQSQPNLSAAEVFTPVALPLIEHARTSCVYPLEADVSQLGLTDAATLVPGGLAKALTPIVQRIVYSTLKFKTPVFTGTGGKDVDVPTAGQLALITDTCKAGSVLESHFYPDQDHNGTLNTSLVDSIPFVQKLLAGKRITSTCPAPH